MNSKTNTPLDLEDDSSSQGQSSAPRGEPNNTWIMVSVATLLVIMAVYFILQVFKSDEVPLPNNPEADRQTQEFSDDTAGIIIDYTGEDEGPEDDLRSVEVNELSEDDKKQLAALYQKLVDLESEHKESLKQDREARLTRIRAPSKVSIPTFVSTTDKKRNEAEIREALSNHLQKDQGAPPINSALQRLSELTAAQTTGSKGIDPSAIIAGLNSGGAGGTNNDDAAFAARLKQKEAFNNQVSSFESKNGFSNFKTFDSPVLDVHTGLQFELDQPIDTRTVADVNAHVVRDVYDSSGTRVLVPAGTKAIGKYNSDMDYGNPRLPVIWNRLSFPTKYCRDIFNKETCYVPIGAIAHDRQGLAGIRGRYDQRILSSMGFAAMFSVISVGPAWLIDQINPDPDPDEENRDDDSDEPVEDPNEIICITETTTRDASDSSNSNTNVDNDGDENDSGTDTNDSSTEMETVVTERCAPRFTFDNGTGGSTDNSVRIDGSASNTDERDLYEDIARDAYQRTDDRAESIYQRLVRRRPYAKIPAGYRFVVYPADDIVFPEGNYKSDRTTAPWQSSGK